MNQTHTSFYGWKLLAVFFIIFFLNGAFPFYGGVVINTYMAAELGIDRSLLGLGFTMFILLIGLASPYTGTLVNQHGPRRIMFFASLLLCANALLMAFLVSQPWLFVLVFGISTGLVYGAGSMIPVQAGLSHWFDKKRGVALSIALCAGGIGGLVAAPLLNSTIVAFDGNWRAGWILVAGATLLAACLTIFVKDKPSDLGQHPDGIPPSSLAVDGASAESSVTWSVKEAARTSSLWLIIYGAIALFLIFNLCLAHGVIHLRDSGLSDQVSSLSIGILVAFSLVGRIGGGLLADRLPIPYIWSAGLALMSGGVWVISSIETVDQVYAYAALVGIGYGASFVSLSAIIGRFFGAASFAPILGVIYLFTSIFGSVSPFVAGIMYDRSGTYEFAFMITMVTGIIGALAVLFARPPSKG